VKKVTQKAIMELVMLLNKILVIYRELLTLAQKKQELLVKNRVQELEKIVQAEQLLLVQADKQENARMALQDSLAKMLNLPFHELTLSRLISIADHGLATELHNLQAEFEKVLTDLKRQNDLNNQLLHQALAFIDYTVNIIAEAAKEEVTYSHKGGQEARQVRQFLDTKA